VKSKQSPITPKYRCQKTPNGKRAFIELDGRRVYLGVHGSDEIKAAYHRLLAEWTANGYRRTRRDPDLTVVELIEGYWQHAQNYYQRDGKPTDEVAKIRATLRPLRELYGTTIAASFGPTALKAVRQRFIDRGHTRRHVNQCVGVIRRVFRWGVENELVPATVFHGLQAVVGLKYGRTPAREPDGVKPVPDATVDATLPSFTPTLRAMVELQRHTGMRPGELVIMRSCDIDTSGKVWVYTPLRHKTQYRGRARQVFMGPKAQALLKPWLRRELEAYIFSPKQSETERRERMHAERVTPSSCGNNPGTNRVKAPKRQPGDRYSTHGYGNAIAYACDRAFPPPAQLAKRKDETHKEWLARLTKEEKKRLRQWRRDHSWSPNQLRHTYATNVRREHGLEAAQVLLGHAACDVTQIYAERDAAKAAAVALKIG